VQRRDRLDLGLAALESVASTAGGEHQQATGPAARIIVQQCPVAIAPPS
jgi:hypothetical protein